MTTDRVIFVPDEGSDDPMAGRCNEAVDIDGEGFHVLCIFVAGHPGSCDS